MKVSQNKITRYNGAAEMMGSRPFFPPCIGGHSSKPRREEEEKDRKSKIEEVEKEFFYLKKNGWIFFSYAIEWCEDEGET